MYITVNRQIIPNGLLYPECDRLRNEFFKLEVVTYGQAIDRVLITSAKLLLGEYALR